MQFVPEIAPEVKRLTVFQRTGNWFMPRKNHRYPRLLRTAFERVPGMQALRRKFVFEYTEALTLSDPPSPHTIGRIGRARSEAFMSRS